MKKLASLLTINWLVPTYGYLIMVDTAKTCKESGNAVTTHNPSLSIRPLAGARKKLTKNLRQSSLE